jgi:Ca2+-binding RTX toxin-like protein
VQLELTTGGFVWLTPLYDDISASNAVAPAFDSSAPTRVALGSGGELIVAATTRVGSQDNLVVTRLIPANGLPIWATITDVDSGSNDAAGALLVQGSTVLVGGSTDGDFLLARYDLSLGTYQGSDVHNLGGLDMINGLAVQSGGRVIAAGRSDGQMAVVGYTAGEFDGLSVELGISTFQGAQAVAVDASDRIVLAGTLMGADDDFVIVRLTSTGGLDSGFGDGGQVVHDFGAGNDSAFALLLDGSDILVAGSADVASQFADFAVARIDSTAGGGGGGGEEGTLTITGLANGPTQNNTITLVVGADGNYHVTIDGEAFAPVPFASVQRIVINAGSGDDVVLVGKSVAAAVEIHGGGGNDVLTGGSGDDLLFGEDGNDAILGVGGGDVFVGGAGNDVLVGGNGKDVLIGGDGSDVVQGCNGDDILVGGSTAHDGDVDALVAIRTIWLGAGDYTSRVNALRAPGGLLAAGQTSGDGDVDLLSGNNGKDWIISDDEDCILGLQKGEIVT